MIHLDGPHMGLNDSRSTNSVRMWNTWSVSTTETVAHMVDWVAEVARGAPGGKLKNVVLRCHGSPGYLQLGEGINRANVGTFRAWRNLVEKVWFSACLVARIPAPPSPGPGGGSNGHVFCQEFARAAHCYVVAPTELQVIGRNRTLPHGCLDTFEGLVLSYNPAGAISWSRRYPSTYEHWYGGWARNPD